MEEFIAAEPALSGSIKLTTGSVEGLPLLPEGGLPSCHTRMPLPGIHVFFYGFPIKTFGNDITPVPSGGIRKSRLRHMLKFYRPQNCKLSNYNCRGNPCGCPGSEIENRNRLS